MSKERVLDAVRRHRRDLGAHLFHFTRSRPVAIDAADILTSLTKPPELVPAATVLREILADGFLRGTCGYVKGSFRCVSFAEWPIAELPALFAMNDELRRAGSQVRYEPYGIAVRKEWAYKRGGRPVIYESDAEFEHLGPTHRWRHVRYEPPAYDFTWEREWRLPAETVPLDGEVVVVVPTAKEAYDLTYGSSALSTRQDPSGRTLVRSHPRWLVVSLDLLGR